MQKITATYRAKLNCQVGKMALDTGKGPEGRSPAEYALYNLLCAVEALSDAIEVVAHRTGNMSQNDDNG